MNFPTSDDIKTIERRIAALRDDIAHSNNCSIEEFSAKVEEVNLLNRKLESFRLSILGLEESQPRRSVLTQEQADALIKERLELERAIALEQSGVVHLATRRKNKLTKSVR